MSQFDKDDVEDLWPFKPTSRHPDAVGDEQSPRSSVDDEVIDPIIRDAGALTTHAPAEMISASHTLGVFQIESPPSANWSANRDRFAEVITDISLFRPGPVKSST